MRGPTFPITNRAERARRMARHRAERKKLNSPQMYFDFAVAEEENARWLPGVDQLTTEVKANG